MQGVVLTVEPEAVDSLAANDEDILRRALVVWREVHLVARAERIVCLVQRESVRTGVDHRISSCRCFGPLGNAQRNARGRRSARPDTCIDVETGQHCVRSALRHATLLIAPRFRQIRARRLQLCLDEREYVSATLCRAGFHFRVGGNRNATVAIHQVQIEQRTQRAKFGLDGGLVRDRDLVQLLQHDVGASHALILLVPDVGHFTQTNDAGRRPALTVQFKPRAVVKPVTAAHWHHGLFTRDLIQCVVILVLVTQVRVHRRQTGDDFVAVLVEGVLGDQTCRIFLQIGTTDHQADGDQQQRAKTRCADRISKQSHSHSPQ